MDNFICFMGCSIFLNSKSLSASTEWFATFKSSSWINRTLISSVLASAATLPPWFKIALKIPSVSNSADLFKTFDPIGANGISLVFIISTVWSCENA